MCRRGMVRTVWVGCAVFLFLLTCGEGSKPVNNPPEPNHKEYQSGCLGGEQVAVQDSGWIVFDVMGNTLNIYHFHAYYNCCLDFRVDYDISGDVITARELDKGAPCRCDCYFDLRSELHYVPDGRYACSVIGIHGDTLASDTLVFGDGAYWNEDRQSKCLEIPLTVSDDAMKIAVVGHTIFIDHLNVSGFCDLEYQVRYKIIKDNIIGYEYDLRGQADCQCSFDLGSVLRRVPSGEYQFMLVDFDGAVVGTEYVTIGP